MSVGEKQRLFKHNFSKNLAAVHHFLLSHWRMCSILSKRRYRMQETEIPNITQEINEKDSQSNGDKFWDENFISGLESKYYY